MGWSIGFSEALQRDIGYGVPAFCDHPGCTAEIDRGLPYVCGSEPYGGEHGCGMHFCAEHRQISGLKRHLVELCKRCYHGKARFDLKPDHPKWMRWKLRHASWAEWRQENPEKVEQIRAALRKTAKPKLEVQS